MGCIREIGEEIDSLLFIIITLNVKRLIRCMFVSVTCVLFIKSVSCVPRVSLSSGVNVAPWFGANAKNIIFENVINKRNKTNILTSNNKY